MEVQTLGLMVLAVVAYALFSGSLERSSITPPMVFTSFPSGAGSATNHPAGFEYKKAAGAPAPAAAWF
ncbi:MAG: hypothetical protein PVG60_02205 [Desulfarculaceae bacterium]|jgi:hypothetical protein